MKNGVKNGTNGTVRFAEEVVCTIAFISASEVPGVTGQIGQGDVTEERMIKKNMLRGIRARFIEKDVQIDMAISVKPDIVPIDVARLVQTRVKRNVENMTGMRARCVNITVASIQHKQENE